MRVDIPDLMSIAALDGYTDGTQLVTGVGSRVLVYDAVDGDLLHSLKG